MRCATAALQESEFCCATFQAWRLVNEMSTLKEEHLAAGSITVLVFSSMNLCIEQVVTLQGGVCLLCTSASWFSLNLELMCLAIRGSLLTLVSSRFIRDDVLNLPCWIFLIASTTGLESTRMRMGSLDSRSRLYSAWRAVATLSPSSSQGCHRAHWSFSRDEWNLTGMSSLSLIAYIVCPMPVAKDAASVLMASWSDGCGR